MKPALISIHTAALKEIILRRAWFPVVVFVIHVICSRVLFIYKAFPSLDIIMHLAGGFAIAYFFLGCLHALEEKGLMRQPERLLQATLLFSLICSAAVFWEFLEYISDHWIKTHAQPDLEDTLLDMLMGIVGGTIYVVWNIFKNHWGIPPDSSD
jgi:hypothetical protein